MATGHDAVSLGDGALDLESLDDGGLGVVDDPSSLVDEAARGVGLDQPRLELCDGDRRFR